MPAPPTPIEVHLSRGDRGKTLGGREIEVRDVGQMQVREPPPPPAALKRKGKAEWRKVWTAGRWLWEDQDYHWVEMLCRAYDDLDYYRKVVEQDGPVQQGIKGTVIAHPLIAEIRRCEETIRKCLSVIGFSPTDRARLHLANIKEASELQKLAKEMTGGDSGTREGAPPTVAGYVEGDWG